MEGDSGVAVYMYEMRMKLEILRESEQGRMMSELYWIVFVGVLLRVGTRYITSI